MYLFRQRPTLVDENCLEEELYFNPYAHGPLFSVLKMFSLKRMLYTENYLVYAMLMDIKQKLFECVSLRLNIKFTMFLF